MLLELWHVLIGRQRGAGMEINRDQDPKRLKEVDSQWCSLVVGIYC